MLAGSCIACDLPRVGSAQDIGAAHPFLLQAPPDPYTDGELELADPPSHGLQSPELRMFVGCIGGLIYVREASRDSWKLEIDKRSGATFDDVEPIVRDPKAYVLCGSSGRFGCSVNDEGNKLEKGTVHRPGGIDLEMDESGSQQICVRSDSYSPKVRFRVNDHRWHEVANRCMDETETAEVLKEMEPSDGNIEMIFQGNKPSQNFTEMSDTTGWQAAVDFANHTRARQVPLLRGWRPPRAGEQSLQSGCDLACGEWVSRADKGNPDVHYLSLAFNSDRSAIEGMEWWRAGKTTHIKTFHLTMLSFETTVATDGVSQNAGNMTVGDDGLFISWENGISVLGPTEDDLPNVLVGYDHWQKDQDDMPRRFYDRSAGRTPLKWW